PPGRQTGAGSSSRWELQEEASTRRNSGGRGPTDRTSRESPKVTTEWRTRAGVVAADRPSGEPATRDQVRDEARAAGLVARAEAGARVTVEVLRERDQVAPLGVVGMAAALAV